MRVLASVLVGATAASAAVTKLADNSAAATRTVLQERTDAIDACYDAVLAVIDLNHSNSVTKAKLKSDPSKTTALSGAPSDNFLGIVGGSCTETTGPSVTITANTQSPAAITAPTTTNLKECSSRQGAKSGAELAGDQVEVIFGGDLSGTDGGEAKWYFKSIDTGTVSNNKAFLVQQHGSSFVSVTGTVWGVSSDSSLVAAEANAMVQLDDTSSKPKGTAADYQTLLSMMHGACSTMFKQEKTLLSTATAVDDSAGTPFSVAVKGVNSAAGKTLAEAEMAVSKAFGYFNLGVFYNVLVNSMYVADTTSLAAKMHLHPTVSNTLAHTFANNAYTKLGTDAMLDHKCIESAMKIWIANGAVSQLGTDGTAKAATALEAATRYQCISTLGSEGTGNTATPCASSTGRQLSSAQQWIIRDTATWSGNNPTYTTANSAANWGVWAATHAANQWGVPLHPVVAGSTLFTVQHPEWDVTVPASQLTSFVCNGLIPKQAASATNEKRENGCQLKSGKIPNKLAALHPGFVAGAIIEVTSTSSAKTFQAHSLTAAVGTSDAASETTATAKLVADLTAGATIRLITSAPVNWQYKKATSLDPGSAACDTVRAEIAKIKAARCDLGEALFQTKSAGSLNHALAVAYGATDKHIASTDVVVPTRQTGWFAQLAADCGLAKKDLTVTTTTTNSTKNDTKPTTSGAWSRFGAVVATAALAALAF